MRDIFCLLKLKVDGGGKRTQYEGLSNLIRSGGAGMGSKLTSVFVNFIVRAAVGMALIFFINQYLLTDNNLLNVGLNTTSFLTSGILGIPGVCLLYGILFYQNL